MNDQPEDLSPQTIVAIDPGETCGYCTLQQKGEGKDGSQITLKEADQKPWETFIYYCNQELLTNNYDKVVIEKYRVRRDTVKANLGKNLRTVKVIGVLEFLCDQNDLEFYLQPAGIGKSFFSHKRLESYDMWIVGKEHARDAIRHGLYYLTFGGNDNVDKKQS